MEGCEFDSTDDLLAMLRNGKGEWRNASGLVETMFRQENLIN
jgi:hypothetical protein